MSKPAAPVASAVVFAYHNVGVRSLEVLLAAGFDIKLVFTHEDDPSEGGWFDSVAECARRYGVEAVTPSMGELPDYVERLRDIKPDFIFSFYYRYLIPVSVLETATRGALNLHGSLLPRYRGRAPVNWAVLAGESETGVSLHYMAAKPDAGDLVGQKAVPILPNDTAGDVMNKVAVAGECLLWRLAPQLVADTAPRTPLDLKAGNYCGRRRPGDGRIDWTRDAWSIHNLVRAVAPPYPGAFSDLKQGRLAILGSHYRTEPARHVGPVLYVENGCIYADCADSRRFRVLKCAVNGRSLTADSFSALADGGILSLKE